jgi:hypothetical protein
MNRRRRLAGIGRLLSLGRLVVRFPTAGSRVRADHCHCPVANADSPRRCLCAIEASELVTDDPGIGRMV